MAPVAVQYFQGEDAPGPPSEACVSGGRSVSGKKKQVYTIRKFHLKNLRANAIGVEPIEDFGCR